MKRFSQLLLFNDFSILFVIIWKSFRTYLSQALTLNLQARLGSAWLSVDNASEQSTQSALDQDSSASASWWPLLTAPRTQALMLYRHLL